MTATTIRSLTLMFAASVGIHGQDFRSATWGMTKVQVMAKEGNPEINDPNRIVYEASLLGLKTALSFFFVDGKLAKGQYALMEKYNDPNLYLINAEKWITPLRERYGEPKTDFRWLNKAYEGDRTRYGLAVSMGHLRILNTWETERTTIQQIIGEQNSAVAVGLVYSGKAIPPK